MNALRRNNNTLQRERDEARHIIALIRSRPESEAQSLYRLIRSSQHDRDVETMIHEMQETAIPQNAVERQLQQHNRQPTYLVQSLDEQERQGAVPLRHNNLQPIPSQVTIPTLGSAMELPSLRSMVDFP